VPKLHRAIQGISVKYPYGIRIVLTAEHEPFANTAFEIKIEEAVVKHGGGPQ
jgi:hypothetical protein